MNAADNGKDEISEYSLCMESLFYMTRGDEDIDTRSSKFQQPRGSLVVLFFLGAPPPVGFEVYKLLEPP